MSMNFVAIIIPLPVSIICLIISIRAFYIYSLSRSEAIMIIALASGAIALSLFLGVLGDTHILPFNMSYIRYLGSCYGIIFIFLCSFMRSGEEIQKLRRWQMLSGILFLALILLTPTLPAFTGPVQPAILNGIRMTIVVCSFLRYAFLYTTKGTRFSLIMSGGFLLLLIGFSCIMPYLFDPRTFVTIYIVGAFIVIGGYSTVMAAYSVG